MKIFVEATQWFKRYTGGKACLELNPEGNITAVDALASIGIPHEEVGFITVNGIKVQDGYIIKEGDKLKVYPLIIGG